MKTIELHILQTYPASNPNRDANGDPKSVVFGGHRRARISSQSLKRAMRDHFQAEAGAEMIKYGVRTKFRERFEKGLIGINDATGSSIDAARAKKLADSAWKLLDDKDAGENESDNSMLFVSAEALDRAIAWAAQHADTLLGKKSDALKAAFIEIVFGHEAIDIALFGRMVAKYKEANVDGATLVAHAFSVNKVASEFDFFTAVDDLAQAGDNKVGMMDSKGFNSSTYYRNLVVDIEQLTSNLGGDIGKTKAAIRSFLRAAIESYPRSMDRSHGKPAQPYAIVAMVRDSHRTTNLADGFLKPVQQEGDKDQAEVALERLSAAYQATASAYPRYRSDATYVATKHRGTLSSFGDHEAVDSETLIEKILSHIEPSEAAA